MPGLEVDSSSGNVNLLIANPMSQDVMPPKVMKKSMTLYKVSDWITDVLYSRNKYKFFIRLATNTSEIKK